MAPKAGVLLVPVVYRTQAGDTLESIAKRFGISVEDLVTANPFLRPTAGPPKPEAAVGFVGAPIRQGSEAPTSAAVASITGGAGSTIEQAINFLVGQGLSQQQAGLLQRLAPELSSAFEGQTAFLAKQAEELGQSPLTAPELTPLEFLQNLQRTGTLQAMMSNPSLTGLFFPNPAVTSRRLRF